MDRNILLYTIKKKKKESAELPILHLQNLYYSSSVRFIN